MLAPSVKEPEIIIAGAGPAGATIARLLAAHGKHVLVVDPQIRATQRLEMIAPAALPVIDALNMRPLLDDAALARPCLGIRRQWATAAIETDDFFRRPGGLGFVVDRLRFDAKLRQMALELGVEFLRGRVSGASRGDGSVAVAIDGGSQCITRHARTIVDASGRAAIIGRRLGAQRWRSERRIASRQAVTQDLTEANAPVWLEVTGQRDGWSYRITGPDGQSESWSVHEPPVEREHLFACDASSACLSPAAGSRWIAIGDAASSFDPITSQGLINALTTALVAAGALISEADFDADAQRTYTDAIHATFVNSERGRAAVYRAV